MRALRAIWMIDMRVQRSARAVTLCLGVEPDPTALAVATGASGGSFRASSLKTENTVSPARCQRVGFREVGVYQRYGQSRGRVIVEKRLGDTEDRPPHAYDAH